jgi:putative phosphoribosyl transferase
MGEGYWNPRYLQHGSSHYGWTDASPAAVQRVHEAERTESFSTAAMYRGSLPPLQLQGKTVLLVDEALITSSSLNSVLLHLRDVGAENVVIVVSVGSLLAIDEIRPEVKEVLCLCERPGCHDFQQRFGDLQLVSEEEVLRCMNDEGERRKREIA